MEIELTDDELWCICNAMDAAALYYDKVGRKDAAQDVSDVNDLVSWAKKAKIEMRFEGITEYGRQSFKEMMAKRKATIRRREGKDKDGNVIELFPPCSPFVMQD